MLFITQLVNGLGLAAPVLIVALAVICVHAATRVLNVAIGATFVLTAYIATKVAAIGGFWGGVLFVLTCLLVPVIVNLIIEFAIARRQRARAGDAHLAGFGATLGVSIAVVAIFGQLTGGQTITLPSDVPRLAKSWNVAGVTIQEITVVLIIVTGLLTVAWSMYQAKSAAGHLFRATATDPLLARAIGVRVNRVAVQSWVIAGLITGVATIVLFIQQLGVGPDSASSFLLIPFAAVIVGGLGSLWGCVIASLVFGIGASLVLFVTGNGAYQDVLVFGVILIIMFIRPQGLGRAELGSRAY